MLHRIRSQPVFLSVCSMVKPIGKPDAGNPPVRFDERGRETERCRMAQATAPYRSITVMRNGRHHRFFAVHESLVGPRRKPLIALRISAYWCTPAVLGMSG